MELVDIRDLLKFERFNRKIKNVRCKFNERPEAIRPNIERSLKNNIEE